MAGQSLEELLPVKHSTDRGYELLVRSVLDQAAHRASLPSFDDEVRARRDGHEEDTGGTVLPDHPGRGEPIQIRHADINQDQIGVEGAAEINRLAAGRRLPDDLKIRLPHQHRTKTGATEGMIIGNHYPSMRRPVAGIGGCTHWAVQSRWGEPWIIPVD